MGWSIIYIEMLQVIISPKNIKFFSLKIHFVLANNADPDEMLHNAAFHLGLHCLPKYVKGISGPKRVNNVQTEVCLP